MSHWQMLHFYLYKPYFFENLDQESAYKIQHGLLYNIFILNSVLLGNTRANTHANAPSHPHPHTCTHSHAHTRTRSHIHMHTHTHTHTLTHMHTCMHTLIFKELLLNCVLCISCNCLLCGTVDFLGNNTL